MSSNKFVEHAKWVLGITIGSIVVAQHPHIHQDAPARPDSGYGAQAVVTSTDTSTNTSSRR
jgi:hypothetical protein